MTVANASILPGPRTRDTEGGEHRRAPRSDEVGGMAWLPWCSYGRDHGIRGHKVAPDGGIIEMPDQAREPRRKPKAVSMGQWAQRGRY